MGTKEIRARLLASKPPVEPATNVTNVTNAFNRDFLRGPGSAVKYIAIHEYYASSCGGCHLAAREMDRVGPEQCLIHIDDYAQQMHENAQQKKWNRFLDFIAYNVYGLEKYKELIRRGVNAHLAEVARKKDYETTQK